MTTPDFPPVSVPMVPRVVPRVHWKQTPTIEERIVSAAFLAAVDELLAVRFINWQEHSHIVAKVRQLRGQS